MNYVELHRHSQYSHDGSGTATWAASYAAQLGQTALGLTEHGNMDNAIEHGLACQRLGIKPIYGCEVYYQPVFCTPKMEVSQDGVPPEDGEAMKHGASRFHLTILCRNREGYRNLCRILTAANAESFYRVPTVTEALLQRHHEGLIVLTGCVSGYIAYCLQHDMADAALEHVGYWQQLFGRENVYLEVQPFAAPGQVVLNTTLCQWSSRYGWPLVMTSDAHFVQPTQYHAHQLMQKLRKPYLDGVLDNFQVRHQHSAEEMALAWNELMGSDGYAMSAINMSGDIADRCEDVMIAPGAMPTLTWLTEAPEEALPKLVAEGLRTMGKVTTNSRGKPVIDAAYLDRVADEIAVLSERGFIPYILLVYDIVRFCRERGIMVNGRGSGCGSEVAHALGFHMVDAVKYGVDFSLFVSASRTSLPDFDLDIEDARKQEVVDYVLTRYPGRAVQIGTYGTYKQKSILASMSRASGAVVDSVAFEYFRDMMLSFPDLPVTLEQVVVHPDYQVRFLPLAQTYCYLYGQVTFSGKHAAGVAITDCPLDEVMVVKRVGLEKEVAYVSSMDMSALDALGILKVDLLGLGTLTQVREALQLAGVALSADTIEDILSDVAIYKAFADGQTLGIFQSEKNVPTRMYQQLKPRSVLDVAIVSACNRPLPLKEGTFQRVLDGRRGKGDAKAFWSHVLKETEGGIVYQDQVRTICIQLAGLSASLADDIVHGISHTYHVSDPALEQQFVQGLMTVSGVAQRDATKLWANMHHYLFKKAHALSYAVLACIQQWIRIHYPLAFYVSLLRMEHDRDKRRVYAAEAARSGIVILTPHVNGGADYEIVVLEEQGIRLSCIQEGLAHLPGIGPTTARAIVDERLMRGAFVSPDDAQQRLKRMASKLAVLQRFGAVSFGDDYLQRVAGYQKALEHVPTYVG